MPEKFEVVFELKKDKLGEPINKIIYALRDLYPDFYIWVTDPDAPPESRPLSKKDLDQIHELKEPQISDATIGDFITARGAIFDAATGFVDWEKLYNHELGAISSPGLILLAIAEQMRRQERAPQRKPPLERLFDQADERLYSNPGIPVFNQRFYVVDEDAKCVIVDQRQGGYEHREEAQEYLDDLQQRGARASLGVQPGSKIKGGR